jgi:hypothetical protein
MSAGIFIWPPVTRWLIDRYCWQGALIVTGAIFLNGVFFAALLRQPPAHGDKREREHADVPKHNTIKENCADFCSNIGEYVPFIIFLFVVVMLQMGHICMITYTPVRADQLNIDPDKIPYLISVLGIVGFFSRPIAGFIGDRVNLRIMYSSSVTLGGCTTILSTQFTQFSHLMITSSIYGVFSGESEAQASQLLLIWTRTSFKRSVTKPIQMLPKISFENRICNKCDSNEVEDETHCLLSCISYETERIELIKEMLESAPRFKYLDKQEQLKILMSCKEPKVIHALGNFLNKVL